MTRHLLACLHVGGEFLTNFARVTNDQKDTLIQAYRIIGDSMLRWPWVILFFAVAVNIIYYSRRLGSGM